MTPTLVLLLLVMVSVIFFSIKALLASKRCAAPESLNLNTVRDALMEQQGWSLERADAARTEYLRFLTMLKMKPGFILVPWSNTEGQDDLDQFWHQHILDTAKYAADCNRLFGRMIHHNPHVVQGSGEESDAVEKTQRLYARTFASGTYGSPVNAIFLTGCSTCAVADSHIYSSGHGSGHGGHGDGGGHSSGGHSCGGHSCGGHGCGGH